jgi:ABC-type uncharacterized transport system auxiliary subunit
MKAVVVSVIAAGALMGCAGGLHSDSPATQVYVIRATSHPQAAANAPTFSLHIVRPVADPGLDSDHIVLVQADHKMSYYVASRWPADLPSVVESLAVDTLRGRGAWSTVQPSSSAFPADYLLQIVIRRFEADYSAGGSAPEVHVVLDCTVGRRVGREIVGSFIAEGSSTAAANRLGDVVAAFEVAANQALIAIGTQTQKVDSPVPSMTR